MLHHKWCCLFLVSYVRACVTSVPGAMESRVVLCTPLLWVPCCAVPCQRLLSQAVLCCVIEPQQKQHEGPQPASRLHHVSQS